MTAHRAVNGWLGALLWLVLPGVAVIFWTFGQMEDAAQARRVSGELGRRATHFLSDLTDAESGQRGYLLTGDAAYLLPYLKARDTLPQSLSALSGGLTAAAAQQHLDAAAPLLQAKLKELARPIEARRQHDLTGALALVASGQDKSLMDALRSEMEGFLAIQATAYSSADAAYQDKLRNMYLGIVVESALALLYALYVAYSRARNERQRLNQLLYRETKRLLEVQSASNTQLQHANNILRDSENKLAVTLSSIGDAVIATDAHAHITLLNPVAQQMTGWTQEQALGSPIANLFKLVNKETRARVANPVDAVLATGVPQALTNHTVLINQAGTELDIADSCAPIRGADEQVVGAVLVFHDVTQQHAAQQALHDSSALIQTIFNTVADGIVTVHAEGSRVESVNCAMEAMFGYSAAELSGQSLGLILPELDPGAHSLSLSQYAQSNLVHVSGMGREVVGRRKNGSTFALEIVVSDMVLRGQRYFTGILRDNTARKAVEAERLLLDQVLQDKNIELQLARVEADKANRAKSEFLSSMSHELRSPLNAILGFAQLMETGLPLLTSPQRGSVNHILRAGWYLLDLINEVLDLSLIESGKLSLSVEPISLPEILEDCHTLIQPLADKRGITLHFPAKAEVLFVTGDRTRVKQVLINLLSNAIKYNREGGTVQVTCQEMDDGVLRIGVQDSGNGLPPEKIAQLFQPFNRLGQEDSASEGTGIGLVVSQRLMHLMGGDIGMSSNVGVGSLFWVELQRSTPPLWIYKLALHHAAPAAVEAPCGQQRTLLYVEDNQANMDLAEQLIARRPDMRLLGAGDGMRGVLMARQHLPDLILMDINLPGISGLQALKMLQEDARTRHIPVLALSANALPRDIERGLEAGFFRYLTKPVRVAEFMEALDQGLALAAQTVCHTGATATRGADDGGASSRSKFA